jgi:3-deoxy-7-phosphoheptulonate synthase/chorismate mutase
MRDLTQLRTEIDAVNRELLQLLQERAELVLEIARVKRAAGLAPYDPMREEAMIRDVLAASTGPLSAEHLRSIFGSVFRASLDVQEREGLRGGPGRSVTSVRVGEIEVGGADPVLFVGPCSVESFEQLTAVAALRDPLRVPGILRGGTFKPRTNHRSFQGLREEGVAILGRVGREAGIPTVTEVLDRASLDVVIEDVDMIQIGARSMYNTELLKAVGETRVPVLLKRAFMATIDEWIAAAEYVRAGGNHAIVLCERGIRSFDYRTRNTLDIAAVPLLQAETGLPVIVDVSHAIGRTDLIVPCARAALAVGANGLMIEVHPDPPSERSDNLQQLAASAFVALLEALGLDRKGRVAPRGGADDLERSR